MQKENQQDSHPDIGALTSIALNESVASHSFDEESIYIHVAECAICKNTIQILMALENSHHKVENDLINEAVQTSIVDYISRGLSITRKKTLGQKIQEDPVSLKAALHYASHSEAMRLKLEATASNNTESNKNGKNDSKNKGGAYIAGIITFTKAILRKILSPFTRLFSWSFSYETPAAYSIVISLIAVTLAYFLFTSSNLVIKTTPNIKPIETQLENIPTPVLQHVLTLTSGGGEIRLLASETDDGKQKATKNNIGSIKLLLKDAKTLTIRWPKLNDIVLYKIKLSLVSSLNEKFEMEISTKKNAQDIALINFESDQEINWVFTAESTDNRIYRASSGFVISQSETP